MPDVGVAQPLGTLSHVAYTIFDQTFPAFVVCAPTSAGYVALEISRRARHLQGLRRWSRRVALQRAEPLLVRDPIEACHFVRSDQIERDACIAALGMTWMLSWASSVACKCVLLADVTPDVWSHVLLTEVALMLVVAFLLFVKLVADSLRFGLPDEAADQQELERRESSLHKALFEHAASGRDSPVTDDTSAIGLPVQPAEIIANTPATFRPIVRPYMRTCLRSFLPTTFEREREYIDHLSRAVQHAREHMRHQHVDILALCVDKTFESDFVERYWQLNYEAARAGVYISRVFTYDGQSKHAIKQLAEAQSNAGVHAFYMPRSELSQHLKATYNMPLFGFTIVRGVDTLNEVILHDGTGDQVEGAAYHQPLLSEHFAGVHKSIRQRAERARKERALRIVDSDRIPIQLQVHGRTLEAVRLDFDRSPGEPKHAMSVALGARLHRGQDIRPHERVLVSASALQLAGKPMRISHVHSVDGVVCRRREHKSCLAARDGDYFIGLHEVA